MRRALPLVVLLLAACGGASAVPGPAPSTQARRATAATTSTGWEVVGDRQLPLEAKNVSAPPGQVFTALVRAYADLGIATTVNDANTLTVGNTDLRLNRRLGEEPLSQYLDCGTTNAGNIANVYRVQMSLVTKVAPAVGRPGSDVTTTVVASARNPTSSSAAVRCASTGRLETLIAQRASVVLGLGM